MSVKVGFQVKEARSEEWKRTFQFCVRNKGYSNRPPAEIFSIVSHGQSDNAAALR